MSFERPGRVVILTSHFPPETFAPAKRMAAVAAAFARKGYNVRVVAPFPHYPQRMMYEGFSGLLMKKEVAGIRVIYLRPWFYRSRHPFVRILSEGVYSFLAFLTALALGRPRVLVVSIPFMFLAVSGLVCSAILRARYVLDVRDLTWDYLTVFKSRIVAAVGRALASMMKWAVTKADVVVTSNERQKTYVEEFRGTGSTLLHENGVDDGLFEQLNRVQTGKAAGNPVTVVYAGLLGYPQNVATLIDALALLHADGVNVRGVIIGDGVEKSRIEERISSVSAGLVELTGYLPQDKLAAYYQTADIFWAQLRTEPIFQTARPSKLLEYMAAGKPIVFGGQGGEAEKLIAASGSGIVVPPEHPPILAAAIRRLMDDPAARLEFARCGRRYASKHLRSVEADAFVENLGHFLQPPPDSGRF
ncbi:MAG: glycosyltransferase family 4 protein [Bacteroidota bacterium]